MYFRIKLKNSKKFASVNKISDLLSEGETGMDVLRRIETLRLERGWTVYRLAELSGLTDKCIYNWYLRNTVPTLETLQKVCDAFGITLSQFFSEGNLVDVDDELKGVFDDWIALTSEQKAAVRLMMKTLRG